MLRIMGREGARGHGKKGEGVKGHGKRVRSAGPLGKGRGRALSFFPTFFRCIYARTLQVLSHVLQVRVAAVVCLILLN